MWCLSNDNSKAVITAAEQINSTHRECHLHLPETAIAQYLGLRAVALLMVSDIHPKQPEFPKWEWYMTKQMKYQLTEQGIALAKKIATQQDTI